jgi:uncharacterized protein (TIGR02145 family)
MKKLIFITLLGLLTWSCDSDKDGFTKRQGDCNDQEPNIHPGAIEICGDSIDQDCDGVDISCDDFDNDNDGYTENQGDCDDNNADINPDAVEICCDGIDQNCDGIGCEIDTKSLLMIISGKKLLCSGIYNNDSDFHKIIFINTNGGLQSFNDSIPYYYKPLQQEEISLIAVMDESWETIETKEYNFNGHSAYKKEYYGSRRRMKLKISVYAASTGKLLESGTFFGGYPANFPQTVYLNELEIMGSSIGYDEIEKWLKPIIKSPIGNIRYLDDISSTSATCYAEVRKVNNKIKERGVCWSSAPMPTIENNYIQAGSGYGEFYVELHNLIPYTKYYLRPYVITEMGKLSYGMEKSFIKLETFTDDRDGKTYKTVQIGNQVWMAENLNYETSSGSWIYNNNSSNSSRYGRLYNWETARKACPDGWHLPSNEEWLVLVNYLISNGYNYDGSTPEDKTAKSLAATSGWKGSSKTGDIGKDQHCNNSTGFTALPGGFFGGGGFIGEGAFAYFWSSTEYQSYDATCLFLSNDRNSLGTYAFGKKLTGLSVRCVKD